MIVYIEEALQTNVVNSTGFLSTDIDQVMNTKVVYDVRTKLHKYCKWKD